MKFKKQLASLFTGSVLVLSASAVLATGATGVTAPQMPSHEAMIKEHQARMQAAHQQMLKSHDQRGQQQLPKSMAEHQKMMQKMHAEQQQHGNHPKMGFGPGVGQGAVIHQQQKEQFEAKHKEMMAQQAKPPMTRQQFQAMMKKRRAAMPVRGAMPQRPAMVKGATRPARGANRAERQQRMKQFQAKSEQIRQKMITERGQRPVQKAPMTREQILKKMQQMRSQYRANAPKMVNQGQLSYEQRMKQFEAKHKEMMAKQAMPAKR